MPIHDVGYRKWKGTLTSTWSRWWVITEAGIAAAFKSRWIRRMLLASWIPVLYLGGVFFAFEKIMETSGSQQFVDITQEIMNDPNLADDPRLEFINAADPEQIDASLRTQQVKQIAAFLPEGEALARALDSGDPSQLRHRVWSWMLMSFLRYPQGIMTLLIVGLLVPPLIARDVRSRAFLLYYSRPINRFEYLIGKLAIPGFLLSLITFLPALVLYFFGVMLSPNLSVLADTWDIPFRIFLATAACVVPTCLLAMLFSSITQESRFAGFAWFTVWGLGAVVWTVIHYSNIAIMAQDGTPVEEIQFNSKWSLVSIYSTIGRVQSWVFGLEVDFANALPSIVLLIALALVCFIGLYRRVSAPVRI